MFEIILFIVALLIFLYLKDKIDQLRDDIYELREKIAARQARESSQTEKTAVAEGGPVIAVEKEVRPSLALEMSSKTVTEKIEPVKTQEWQGLQVSESRPVQNSDDGIEFKVGSKIFTAVGVVAVICAIGFFLRYAFENDLINEFWRVALGVIAGMFLLLIGEITRKQFPNYGQALTGGGLGVLYVSFYSAFNFYQLIAQPVAFFAMILVTAAGILLSLRQNSMAVALFAQVGGFLTPLLISSGSNNPHVLFLYVALLDLAVFLTAFYKLWQPLSLVGFVGTALTYLYWYFNFYSSYQFIAAQGYLTLFFVIFLCVAFIQYFVKKSPENSSDLFLISANPMFYFAASYAIIDPLYHDFMGPFAILLGAFYCALAAVVGGKSDRDSLFRHFLLTAGFVLLVVAVPIQFEGKWMVAAWAAEALAFIAVGFKMSFPFYRGLGNVLLLAAFFKLLALENALPESALPVFNGRFFTYAIFVVIAAAAACLYRRIRKEGDLPLFDILALEVAFAAVAGSSVEIQDFLTNSGKWTVIAWAAEALVLLFLGFRFKLLSYRVFGHILFWVALFRLFFGGSGLPASALPLFNLRLLAYLVLFAVAVIGARAYRRRKLLVGSDEKIFYQLFLLAGAFSFLAGFSWEISDFSEDYWYPMLWSAGGLAAGYLSFRLDSKTLRAVTYMTFSAAVVRLLGLAIDDLRAYLPVFNTYVISFVFSAAVIRVFLSMLRQNRGRVTQDEFDLFHPALFIAFHLLLLWMISGEISHYCQKLYLEASGGDYYLVHKKSADLENLKNVLLSVAWTIYGAALLVAGIIKKTTYERFGAIALFMVVIIKVFLVDTANLGDLYRFFSFITLGCFLLLAGYLYYRYQNRIREFVKGG